MQVQVARVWWPQTFYPTYVSVLSSCVSNGRVLQGKCAIFFICIKYKNGLLNVLVRNDLSLEKITQVVATWFLLLELCIWSWCIGLRICELCCLLCPTRYLN